MPADAMVADRPVDETPPPAEAASTAPRPSLASAPRELRPVRVLVADDDPDNAGSLADVLIALGYEVDVALDGLHALEQAEAFRPHAAVLDIDLPGMDGMAIARHLRAQEWSRDMALIALTGWTRDLDRTAAFACGFSHFVPKPANIESLLTMLPSAGSRTGTS